MRVGGRTDRDGEGSIKKPNSASRRPQRSLRERAARGNVRKALRILDRAGVGNPPVRGDKVKRRAS